MAYSSALLLCLVVKGLSFPEIKNPFWEGIERGGILKN